MARSAAPVAQHPIETGPAATGHCPILGVFRILRARAIARRSRVRTVPRGAYLSGASDCARSGRNKGGGARREVSFFRLGRQTPEFGPRISKVFHTNVGSMFVHRRGGSGLAVVQAEVLVSHLVRTGPNGRSRRPAGASRLHPRHRSVD